MICKKSVWTGDFPTCEGGFSRKAVHILFTVIGLALRSDIKVSRVV